MNETILNTYLNRAKLALRVTTDAFDEEIKDIIKAGYMDLQTRGVNMATKAEDPLVVRALITYVRMHFGEPENPERLERSYWEQKAALMSTSGYTDWGGADGQKQCH